MGRSMGLSSLGHGPGPESIKAMCLVRIWLSEPRAFAEAPFPSGRSSICCWKQSASAGC